MSDVYIGYDPREAVAYHVCTNSIIRHATKPVRISPLALKNLDAYVESDSRKTTYQPTNQFIFSRFLIPYLNNYKGWALFIDGDMIVLDDIHKLFDLVDETKAVMVVKHDYKTKYPIKYLGQKNEDYERKNWSSVMLFNCAHPDCAVLTPENVAKASGRNLHRFEWTTDENIGDLPMEWNWLDMEYGYNDNAKLIHYTVGTPCFIDYSMSNYSSLWHRESMLTNYCKQVDDPDLGDNRVRK